LLNIPAHNYQTQFIQINELQIHTIQNGAKEQPLVLLLHGFPEFWQGWIHQIQPLAEAGFWVWVPDQRGYNLSSKPREVSAYRLEFLAEDVLSLIAAAGRKRAYIVGHDWGAAVAWHLATYYPESVEKLVILNVPHPGVMVRTVRSSLRQFLKSWYIYVFQIPRLPEIVLRAGKFALLRGMLRASSQADTFPAAALTDYTVAWGQPGVLTSMLNWYRAAFRGALRSPRQSANLSNVRIQPPTLILWGVKDVALDHRMAQLSLDLCREGRLVFYENGTHWVQHDEAEAVNKEIIQFLSA
jgi:pimeloyl-ACP methyl ester carboxylesterase